MTVVMEVVLSDFAVGIKVGLDPVDASEQIVPQNTRALRLELFITFNTWTWTHSPEKKPSNNFPTHCVHSPLIILKLETARTSISIIY